MNDNDLYFIYYNKVNMSFIPTPNVSGGDIREPFNYNDVKVLRLGGLKNSILYLNSIKELYVSKGNRILLFSTDKKILA
jgi:hypothetical protein